MQLAPAWFGLVWREGKIIRPFEVLGKRTSGSFTVPTAKQFAANFVSLDLSSCDQVIEKEEG